MLKGARNGIFAPRLASAPPLPAILQLALKRNSWCARQNSEMGGIAPAALESHATEKELIGLIRIDEADSAVLSRGGVVGIVQLAFTPPHRVQTSGINIVFVYKVFAYR